MAILQSNKFYAGFLKFYEQQQTITDELLRGARNGKPIDFDEYHSLRKNINKQFKDIETKISNDGSALEDIITNMNLVKGRIGLISNPHLKELFQHQYDIEKRKWDSKMSTRSVTAKITNKKLLKAMKLYDSNNPAKALELVLDVLDTPNLDTITKQQATLLNNTYVEALNKRGEEMGTIHSSNGVIDWFENAQINNDITKIYKETKKYVDENIDFIKGEAINKDPQSKKKQADLLKDIRKHIIKKQEEGIRKLQTRNLYIANFPDTKQKTDTVNGLNGIEKVFIENMTHLIELVDMIQSQLLNSNLTETRNNLLNMNMNELDKLLEDNKDVNKNVLSNEYLNFANKMSRLSNSINRDIDEEEKRIKNELSKTTDPVRVNDLNNQLLQINNKRAEYRTKSDLEKFKVKRQFENLVPKIKEAIKNIEAIKKIEEELKALFNNFSFDNTTDQNKQEINKAINISIDTNQESVEKIMDDLPNIIKELQTAKTLLFSLIKTNLNIDDKYDEELTNYFNRYFDSYINSFQTVLRHLNADKHNFNEQAAIDKAEKVVRDYSTIDNTLKDCNVPSIYAYYHIQFFNCFRSALGILFDRYQTVDYNDIDFIGADNNDLIYPRLQALKQKMNVIENTYNERYKQISEYYNTIINEQTEIENKQVKEIEDTIKTLNINQVFKDYVKARKNNGINYKDQIENLKSLKIHRDSELDGPRIKPTIDFDSLLSSVKSSSPKSSPTKSSTPKSLPIKTDETRKILDELQKHIDETKK